eukprot:scaffold192_cov190-Pinguiococcus_pyrenoidosus.AAC.4
MGGEGDRVRVGKASFVLPQNGRSSFGVLGPIVSLAETPQELCVSRAAPSSPAAPRDLAESNLVIAPSSYLNPLVLSTSSRATLEVTRQAMRTSVTPSRDFALPAVLTL